MPTITTTPKELSQQIIPGIEMDTEAKSI